MRAPVLFRGLLARWAFFALLAIGVVLLVTPRSVFPEWLFPRLTALGCLIYAGVLVGLPLVFRADDKKPGQRQCLARLQRFMAAGFLLAMGGTLGLYELHAAGFDYDKVLHYVVPVLGTIGLMQFVHAWHGVTRRIARARAVALVLAGMFLWELLELGSDLVFGTKAFGQQGKDLFADTSFDLLLGVAGIATGALWMASSPARWTCEPCGPFAEEARETARQA